MRKVYHIEKKGEQSEHHYFGSQMAIFDRFTPDELGIGYKALSNHYDLEKAPYENKKFIIRKGLLHSKKTNRGIKKQHTK